MTTAGRPRDEALDRAILDRATEVLSSEGVDAINFSRIAELAGTSRPALYRRYGSPEELIAAALNHLAVGTLPPRTGDHLVDLEAELTNFRDGITRTNSIALVGSMLAPSIEASLAAAYRERLVGPRRSRIRDLLTDARRANEITATPGDLEVAITMCTGSFYAYALAGVDPPKDWPRRTARLVWQAAGGSTD